MIENFKGKNNTNGLADNPENINKNGRPKKGISLVNQQLRDMGYEPATKQDIQEVYLNLIQLTPDEISELTLDDSQPILVHTIARSLTAGQFGMNIIERILDRGIGKPMQETKTDLTTDGQPMHITVKLPE